MTKQEYIDALNVQLRDYPADFRSDILDAFEGHFQEGLNAGKTEDEIIEDLGSVRDVAENIRMMHGSPEHTPAEESYRNFRNNLNELKSTLKDTIRSMTDVMTQTVNTATDIVADLTERTDSVRNEETGIITGAKTIRILTHKAVLDTLIEPGDELKYEFVSKPGLFSKILSVLTVRQDQDEVSFNVSEGHAYLHLSVPQEVAEINFDISGGGIEIQELSLNRILGKTASADIRLDRMRTGIITVRTSSGDIRVRESSFSQLEAETASGDIILKMTEGNALLKCSSGDIAVDRHLGEELTVSSASGDLEIDPVSVPVINMKTASGDIELHSTDYPSRIELSSASGDIDCTLESRDYTAEISTISGDIDLESDIFVNKMSAHRVTAGDGTGRVSIHSVSGDISLS